MSWSFAAGGYDYVGMITVCYLFILPVRGSFSLKSCRTLVPPSSSPSTSRSTSQAASSTISPPSVIAPLRQTPSSPTGGLVLLLVLHQVDYLIRNPEVFDLYPESVTMNGISRVCFGR